MKKKSKFDLKNLEICCLVGRRIISLQNSMQSGIKMTNRQELDHSIEFEQPVKSISVSLDIALLLFLMSYV